MVCDVWVGRQLDVFSARNDYIEWYFAKVSHFYNSLGFIMFCFFVLFLGGGGDTHMLGIPYTFKMNVSVFFNFMPNKCNRQVCDS